MTQINSSASLSPVSVATTEGVWTMSNGALLAIFEHSGGDYYSVSGDSGATWSAATIMPAGWVALTSICQIIQRTDVLWAFEFTTDGAIMHKVTFAPGPNTLSYTSTVDSRPWGPGGLDANHCSVVDDGTNFLLVNWSNSGSYQGIEVTELAPDLSYNSPTYLINFHTTAVADLVALYVPGTSSPDQVLAVVADTNLAAVYVLPLTYNTGSRAWNSTSVSAERAYSLSTSDVSLGAAFDGTGKLDIIIRDGANLYAVKRTGTGSYSAPVPLYNGVAGGTRGVATAYDVATGNLYVPFRSNANQATGEIYAVKRSAGIWGGVSLLAGGNADGYSDVLCARTLSGTTAPAILNHGAAVDYLGITGASAPFTPTVSQPSGYITTLTPLMAAPYVNPSPSDPIGFQQWQVQRVSDSSVFLDTGKVSTTAPSLLYAGTALVYGTQYQARVKDWDSISAAGAGSPSGFSAWSPFTPIHGPVATITSIIAGGATISSTPGTLTAPTMVVNATYTQADSHNASSYRLKIYAADGVSLIAASSPVAGTIAPGGSITTASTTFPQLINSTVYKIAVETTDAVTGLAADGPQWQLTTAWTPPATPSGLTVTAYPDLGTVVGTWTNGGDAVTNNVYALLPGGTWVLYKSGSLFTTFTARPPATLAVSYRVTALAATGVESAPAVATVTMGLRGTAYGVWLTDIEDPSRTVAVGHSASWSDLKWAAQKERDNYLPLGGRYQKSARGLEYWQQAQMKFWIFGAYPLLDGSLAAGKADVAMLQSMDESVHYLHYRDPGGTIKIVELYAFDWAPDDPSTNFNVEFSLDEMATVSPLTGPSLALLMT